jgi:hypothetical protein
MNKIGISLVFLGIFLGFILGMIFCQAAKGESIPDFNRIVDSIYLAEGGAKAKKPFGILSVPCYDYETCRIIAYNTVRNNYRRWQAAGESGEYLEFLAQRYAPLGAANDPRGLNKNWIRNVRYFLEKSNE